ncbi:helix-turn-helix transcriptional regulator [Marasmitruncus massiliensis]|uniref:helix-turn-helix transcriptional regulator n=1 Tax=Marasmitruncus massiliensis TaxID=1944642 RepID=UPI0015E0D70E|nr:helix-turn-helix transcriptional regulator [Marasmitruncus massiliensis]
MTKDEIAKILKEIRIKAGYTQKQAAEKVGRKQQTLASWETGQSQPDADTLFALCDIYGVSVDEAFGFKKIPSVHSLSAHEEKVILAYRNHPAVQYAIDKLLEIETPSLDSSALADDIIHTMNPENAVNPAKATKQKL